MPLLKAFRLLTKDVSIFTLQDIQQSLTTAQRELAEPCPCIAKLLLVVEERIQIAQPPLWETCLRCGEDCKQ